MLNFFRKHQRFVFTVITVVVILSFSFFGTFSVIQNIGQTKKDKLLTRAIDGSKVYENEIKKMASFLNSDRDQDPLNSSVPVNLLNDGVMRKDFLETGIASLIAKEYHTFLSPKLSLQWERVKRFHPYQHPNAPFLSANLLWERFAPKLKENLILLKSKESFGPDEFSLLADLYLEQAKFPASALRRWVTFQQRQYQDIPFDQRLYHDDLALFGFHTMSDWFSAEFLELASEFVWNSAILAEKEGIRVSSKEAKEDLWKSFLSYMQETFAQEKLTASAISTIFQRQINALGMNEKSAVEIWRKILLFRKVFEAKTKGLNLDPLASQELSSFAGMRAVVESYSLPKTMQLQNVRDVLLLQMYLKAVSPAKEGTLAPPKEYFPVAKIKETYPSLIKGGFLVEIAYASKEELALKVKVKEMWQWQLEEANWKLLAKEFPALASKGDHFAALKNIDKALRAKVDAFSLQKIVENHPEWIQETLDQKEKRAEELNLALLQKHPLPGIQSNEDLISLLEKALGPDQKEAVGKLRAYTQDGKTYFSIDVKKDIAEEILSFEDARSLKALDPLLDELLEKEYSKVRSKAQKKFKNSEGDWKPFEEIKNDVGELVFSELFKTIDKESSTLGEDSQKHYTALRFQDYLKEAKEEFVKDPANREFLSDEKEEKLFSQQWKLHKKMQTLSERDPDYRAFDLSSVKEGEWTEPSIFSEKASFLHVLRKEQDPAYKASQVKEDALQIEGKRIWAERILHEWNEKKAIVFPRPEEVKVP